jgi:RimJ/RimL family protein N-acetyltransferase
MEVACGMIEKHLTETISFMKSQNFIHFDAHFHNILTDGNHLYFSDFGLATASKFELSEEEREFFNYHLDYDSYSATTNFLHCLVTHYVGKDKWIESLHELMNEKLQKLPLYFSAIIKRYAPTALLMDKFFRDLQKDKTTIYPAKELELAWDAVEKIVTYQIKTKRIGIRLLEKEDINYLFELESDPEVQKFSPSGAKTYKQTEAVINEFISDYKEKGLPCFILFDLVSGEFIGRAAFIQWEAGDIEVGYSLHKKFWGMGYATEVLTLLLAWARKNIVTDYISACSESANLASLRVLEKCGMEYYKSSIEHGVECRFYRIKNR